MNFFDSLFKIIQLHCLDLVNGVLWVDVTFQKKVLYDIFYHIVTGRYG